MIKKFSILLLFLLSTITNAQLTQKWVAFPSSISNISDLLNDLQVDDTGNIYVAGTLNNDYLTIKYDSSGIELWRSTYNAFYNDIARSLAVDDNGNVYVTGVSTDSSGWYTDVLTIKYNSNGVQQWVQRYNGQSNYSFDEGNAIVVDMEGNSYVTGNSIGLRNYSDFITIKYSPAGNELWVERYDGAVNGYDISYLLSLDSEANAYVAGITSMDEYNLNTDWTLIKYSTDGVFLWIKTLSGNADPGSSNDMPTDLCVDTDNNVYLTGRIYNNLNGSNITTIKYNPQGTEQWLNYYNANNSASYDASSLIVDDSINVYVTGSYGNSASIIKYNNLGVEQWAVEDSTLDFSQIVLNGEGSIYVIGSVGMAKYNYEGIKEWEYNYFQDYYRNYNKLAIDNQNNLVFIGLVYDQTNSSQQSIVAKYSEGVEPEIQLPPTNLSYNLNTHSLRWNKSLPNNVSYYLIYKQEFNPWTSTAGPWVSVADSGGNVNINDSIWTIQTSGFYNYKVGAVFATDTLFSDSIFVEMGYFLRKIENNKVIAYNYETDQFKLIRNSENWPASWYNQFNYNNPFSYAPPILFFGTPNQTYCDWPLFTEIIGNDQAYLSESLNISNLISVSAWKYLSDPAYNGSCAGFSIASVLNFYQDQYYLQQFPYMVNKTPGLIPNTDSEARKVINHLQNTQSFPYPTMLNYEPSDPNNSNANYVLNRLIEIFSNYSNTRLDQYISLTSNDSGLHAVVPIAIRMVSSIPNRYDIEVYDSNDPEDIIGIKIHTDKNTWSYIGLLVDSSASGIALRGSITSRLGLLTWKEPENGGGGGTGPLNINATERIIYISDSSSVAISINDEVIAGYNISNNSIVSFENSIIEATDGAFNSPKGFIVPNVESKVIFSDQISGSKASMLFQSDSKNYYVAERTSNALNGEVETIEIINEGFNYLNTDNINKTINLTTMSETYQNNKFAQLSNLIIAQNDSLGFWFQNDSLNLKNTGGSKNYKITLINADPNGKSEFINEPVSISANSTHILSPDWADLGNDILLVLIDNNNDGMIDDSLLLPNQYDPLPVELTSFTGKYLNNGVSLYWQTATEINNYGFEVERKLNIKGQTSDEWTKIGFVEGNGNSNSPKYYIFQDKKISGSRLFYRLKQIDNDGTFSYSNEVEIDLSNLAISYSLNQNYPNPFNPSTQISFSLPKSGFVSLKIYNAVGELVKTLVNENKEEGYYNIEWSASDDRGKNLASGMYLYRLQVGGFVETKKMILIR